MKTVMWQHKHKLSATCGVLDILKVPQGISWKNYMYSNITCANMFPYFTQFCVTYIWLHNIVMLILDWKRNIGHLHLSISMYSIVYLIGTKQINERQCKRHDVNNSDYSKIANSHLQSFDSKKNPIRSNKIKQEHIDRN